MKFIISPQRSGPSLYLTTHWRIWMSKATVREGEYMKASPQYHLCHADPGSPIENNYRSS